MCNNMDVKLIDGYCGVLKEILLEELRLGNRIIEMFDGDWPCPNIKAICLEYPFKTPIRRRMKGIIYREINDPRYWKSDYFDKERNLILTCGFGTQGMKLLWMDED